MARASTGTEKSNVVGAPESAPILRAPSPITDDSLVSTPIAATPIPNRPKAIGLNSNVMVDGARFHVQTEDLWPSCAQIVTHVFEQSGRVVRVDRTDYSQHLEKATLPQLLRKVMMVHHARMVSKLARSHAHEIPAFDDPERSSGAFKISAQSIWDRLVAEAQRERRPPNESELGATLATAVVATPRHEPSAGVRASTSSSWDRAVRSCRSPTSTDPNEIADPALDAYRTGLEEMRHLDKTKAVVCFALAVQLEPHNRRYRAGLRHALDWLDGHERNER